MMSLAEVMLRWAFLTITLFFLLFISLLFVESTSFEGFTWACYAFFTLLSCALFLALWWGKRNSPKFNATQAVFYLVALRFLLSAAFITIYIIVFALSGVAYILPFFILYLVFTVFEITYLQKYSNYLEKRS